MDRISKASPRIFWNGSQVDISLQDLLDQVQEGDCLELGPGRFQGPFQVYQKGIHIRGQAGTILVGQACASDLDSQGQMLGTFATPTLTVNADGCHLEGLTILNEAPDLGKLGQALALYLEGEDLSLSHCHLISGQDTLCIGPLPFQNMDGSPMLSPLRKRRVPKTHVSFDHCRIEGTVDFIFGGGQASFIQCQLHARYHSSPNYLTAASTPQGQKGFFFDRCSITGESPYYLGRPWRDHAWVCFESCSFDSQLLSQGWHDWHKSQARETAHFIERGNQYQTSQSREDWITLEGRHES